MSNTEETTHDELENDANEIKSEDKRNQSGSFFRKLSELADAMREGGENQRMRLNDYFREYGLFVGLVKAASEAVKRVLVAPFVVVAAGLQTMGFNLERGREYERSARADKMRERDRAGRAFDREAEKKKERQRDREADPDRKNAKTKAEKEKSERTEPKEEKEAKPGEPANRQPDKGQSKDKPVLSEAEKNAIKVARNVEAYKRGMSNLTLNHFGKRSNSFITMFDRETKKLCFAFPVQENYESLKKGDFGGLVNNVADLERGVAFVDMKDLTGSDATKIMDVYNALEKNSEKEPKTEKEIKESNKLTLYRAVSSAIALRDMHIAIAPDNYPTDMIKAGKLSFVFSPKRDENDFPVAGTEKIEVMYGGEKVGVLPWVGKDGETLEKMEDNVSYSRTASSISRMVNKYFKENGIDCIDLGLTKKDLRKREQEAMVSPYTSEKYMTGKGEDSAIYMTPNPLLERLEKKTEDRLKRNIDEGLKKDPAKLLRDIRKYFFDDGKQYATSKYDFLFDAVRQCKSALDEKETGEKSPHGESQPDRQNENQQPEQESDHSEAKPGEEKKPEHTYVNMKTVLTQVDKEMMHELFFASFEKDGQNNIRRDPEDFLHVYSQHSSNGEAAISAAKRMMERDEVYESYDDMMDDVFSDSDFVKEVQENAAKEQSEPQQDNGEGVGVFDNFDEAFDEEDFEL